MIKTAMKKLTVMFGLFVMALLFLCIKTTSFAANGLRGNEALHNPTDGGQFVGYSYIYFGSYPQSEVTDADIIAKIDAEIGERAGDCWVDGIKYRKANSSYCNRTDNWGEAVYRYFKWERVKWRVLDIDTENGLLFLLADEELDCRCFCDGDWWADWTTNNTIAYWLTQNIYNGMFSDDEQADINYSFVKCKGQGVNGWEDCYQDSYDYIFFLSYVESKKADYGFSTTNNLIIMGTDYAHAMGGFTNGSKWWLRSRGATGQGSKHGSVMNGGGGYSVPLNNGNTCIVPAMKIKLDSSEYYLIDDGTSGEGGDTRLFDIEYVLGGGVNNANNPSEYRAGVGVTAFGNPTRAEDVFEGWYFDEEYTQEVSSVSVLASGKITLYAKWKPAEYNISYVLGGGTNAASNPAKYTYGTGVEKLNEPSKSGYKFDGWYTDSLFTNKVTSVSTTQRGNITLYAKWKKPYEVPAKTYDKNSITIQRPFTAKFLKNKFSVIWGKVKDADGYDIYAVYCGNNVNKSLVKSVKQAKSSKKTLKYDIKKINNKSLKTSKECKVIIKAYKIVDGNKYYIGESYTAHLAGPSNKATNVKSIKPDSNTYKVKKGKSCKIKVTLVKENSSKCYLSTKHGAKLRFTSANEKVAKVDKKGKVKGIKKGTTYIYITALNGLTKEVKVVVK